MFRSVAHRLFLRHFGNARKCHVQNRFVSKSGERVPSLVSTEWLNSVLSPTKSPTSRVMVVHAVMRGEEFDEAHIPQATCFNTSICRDTASQYPNMLPKPDAFEKYVNEYLSATNDDHLIIYDSNKEAPSLFPGARVWFMFKIFGHDKVSLLNGGLYRWLQEGRAISKHEDSPLATKDAAKKFKASFRPELLAPFEEVLKNVEGRNFQVVDARGPARFKGQGPDPYGKSGHIPNSVNMPFNTFVDPATKLLLDDTQLKKMFNSAKVNLDKPLIVSCGTGMTACAPYFAAFLCGKNDTKLYNGSWAEWINRVDDNLIATN